MPQDLTNFDEALKIWYGPRMNATINEKRVLLSRLRRNADPTMVSGKQVTIPVNIRGSQSLGARSGAGPTPAPQRQTIVEMRVNMNYLYGTIQFDLPTILASRNDAGAFARVMDSEMKGIRRDAQNDLNRQMFGDSLGSLGTVNGAVTASTSVTVDSGHNIKAGMIVDIYTDNSGDPSTTRTVDSVQVTATTATTLTMGTAITCADGAHVIREDARGQELLGLDAIVDNDTGTIYQISRSTYPEWQANEVDASSQPLSLALMQEAFTDAEENGEGDLSLGVTDYTQWRKYGNLLVGDRRFPTALSLDGGFTALDFNGIPIVPDRDCQTQRMYFLDESTFTIYEMTAGWQWDETDGRILHKVSRQAAYEALLYNFCELACDDPKNNSRIVSLAA